MVWVWVFPLYQRIGTGVPCAACPASAAGRGDTPLEYCSVSPELTIAAAAQRATVLRTTARRICGRMVTFLEQEAGGQLHRPRAADGGSDLAGGPESVRGKRGRGVREYGHVEEV